MCRLSRIILVSLWGLLAAPSTRAESGDQATAVKEVGRTPAGKGQPALGIGLRGDQVVAAHCRRHCDWANAATLALPVSAVADLKRVPSERIGGWRRVTVLRGTSPTGACPIF